ncbi:MFS transporter, partial [Enterobacter sp. DRP3]|nr:MFS transporter [Enterobacter sp. DRP3]
NASLPDIRGSLGASFEEGSWITTAYLVAEIVVIPLTGWLTQRFGQVRLFVTSILLFVFASWLCGIAPNLPTLLAARILQGAVAGPLAPLSQALLLGAWPRQKSSTALALWSMTA